MKGQDDLTIKRSDPDSSFPALGQVGFLPHLEHLRHSPWLLEALRQSQCGEGQPLQIFWPFSPEISLLVLGESSHVRAPSQAACKGKNGVTLWNQCCKKKKKAPNYRVKCHWSNDSPSLSLSWYAVFKLSHQGHVKWHFNHQQKVLSYTRHISMYSKTALECRQAMSELNSLLCSRRSLKLLFDRFPRLGRFWAALEQWVPLPTNLLPAVIRHL